MGLQDYKMPEKRKRRGLWPVYGLMMAIALGGIAYIASPLLLQYIRRRSPQFSVGNLTDQQAALLFAGIIFLALLALVTMLLTLAVPKKKSQVLDKQLVQEKKEMEAARRARKKRQLEIERKMREENRRRE
ncbi:MAG: hypothetical protein K8J31_22935 [Anaerolineae bacterium]|nr:hypothetical protein [Anaerolineae bacterium]